MSVAKYSSTNDDKLGNLFWADGVSRADYQYFGDVVAFDATYRKNKYNRPLVIFSGANHHKQTCIFGFGLLGDECTESYKWLLENFLDVMMGKEPRVVVTDGDRTMREAIRVVFPNATHRLCGWHLQKNATSNLKSSGFCEALKGLIYGNYDVDVFEDLWEQNIHLYELEENEWVKKLYEMKEMWATTYLRDKFCAGFRTSRCEGINAFIKQFVRSRHSILELVQNLERAVAVYRNNEIESHFKSIYGVPVLTTGLEGVERSAASLYTREIFKDVKKQIEEVITLIVVGIERIGTTVIYKVAKYGRPEREYIVLFDSNIDKYECKCQMWNGYGIPCSHLFCVMKNEHVVELPKSLVLKRWCKDAKSYVGKQVSEGEEDNEKNVLMRYGALSAASQWMPFLGSKRLSLFQETMEEVCKISDELEHKCGLSDDRPMVEDDNRVADPDVVRSKGAPRSKKENSKKRRCSQCKTVGHTKRSCPTFCRSSSRMDEYDLEIPCGSGDDLSYCEAGNEEVVEEMLASVTPEMTVNWTMFFPSEDGVLTPTPSQLQKQNFREVNKNIMSTDSLMQVERRSEASFNANCGLETPCGRVLGQNYVADIVEQLVTEPRCMETSHNTIFEGKGHIGFRQMLQQFEERSVYRGMSESRNQ